MSWLDMLRSILNTHRPRLSAHASQAVREWQLTTESDFSRPARDLRWVVVDVESSGLNMHSDRLLAIGAVALRSGAIDIADSFEVVLRQARPSSGANILVHGIGGTEQRAGSDPVEALLAFLSFIGKDPLVAFHAFFDEHMLRRSLTQYLGLKFDRTWLDLAQLAPAVVTTAQNRRGLDDWLAHFDIRVSERHRAVADAMATAQLFQSIESRADGGAASTGRNLLKLADDFRWLAKLQPGR